MCVVSLLSLSRLEVSMAFSASGRTSSSGGGSTSRATVKAQQQAFHAPDGQPAAHHVPEMEAEERLTLIRNCATRIEHALEVHRHVSKVYTTKEETEAQEHVNHFLDDLEDEVPFLLMNREDALNLGYGWISEPVEEGQQDKRELPRRARIVNAALTRALKLRDRLRHDTEASENNQHKGNHVDPRQLMSGSDIVASSGELLSDSVSYPEVQHHILEDVIVQLKDLVTLLPQLPDMKIHPQPTRMINASQQLQDAVRHFIDDADSLHQSRLLAYIQESMAEVARFSATLPVDTSVTTGAEGSQVFNLVSVFLVDAAVGVFPGRNARIVIDHLNKFISTCNDRVGTEVTTVEGLVARATSLDEKDDLEVLNEQLPILKTMHKAVKLAESATKELASQWQGMEETYLGKAIRGDDQKTLIEAKKVFEVQTIERAQEIHQRLRNECLPFVCPQYCRKQKLTYGNPCAIRVGIKLFDGQKRKFVTMKNLNPSVVSNEAQADASARKSRHSTQLPPAAAAAAAEIDEYLLPSSDQLWFPFDQFPEIIKGERCVLRESVDGNAVVSAATKDQHVRGLDEQREVGGYFLLRGGERILRALLMQRANVPLCIDRSNFATSGPNFTSKAIVVRSKRKSGATSHNYFFSTTTGEVLFSFARRMVWHIPIGLILFSLKTISHSAVHNMLVNNMTFENATTDQQAVMVARAEALLQHHVTKPYGQCSHYKEFLAVLGRMYRQYQQKANTFHFIPDLGPSYAPGTPHQDAWYGLFMIRRHVLPHLNCSAATPDLINHCMTGTEENLSDDNIELNQIALQNWPGPEIEAEIETKFNATIDILRQLNGFVSGAVAHQGNDIPCFQEVFAPSQILLAAFESSASKYLRSFVIRLAQSMKNTFFSNLVENPHNAANLQKLKGYVDHANYRGSDALGPLHKLLITGNFVIENEDYFYMPQNSGWVVMADHLNFFRFFEQMRVLHRGKRVADMRSSEVRKFPCEAFGFLCMVHSPDGADCGVLNHMTIPTIVTTSMTTRDRRKLQKCLDSFPTLIAPNSPVEETKQCVPVILEGEVVGYVPLRDGQRLVQTLRKLKMYDVREALSHYPPNSEEARSLKAGIVPRSTITTLHQMECIFVAPNSAEFLKDAEVAKSMHSMHAGVYIFTANGRLMRPIKDLKTGNLVYVGTWEHIWMDIAGVPSDLVDAKYSLRRKYQYIEPSGSGLISLTSATIPYFEHNCSPRNLFQCGLSKQSSGTQLQSASWRREAKLFRTITPQRYLVRTLPMDTFGLDEFSLGVNAVVAILAHTGYDMDDAVIVNHSSVERGMLNAMITISKVVDLSEYNDKTNAAATSAKGSAADAAAQGITVFHNIGDDGKSKVCDELRSDGLPMKRTPPGLTGFDRDHKIPQLHDHSPVYCTAKRFERKDANGKIHYEYQRHHISRWRSFDKGEQAWVHNVVPLTYDGTDVTSALFVFRIPRVPTVGDKFSSRHGQKGTLPLHFKSFDLPFSAQTGLTPDVLINPHAFPSRMTVGMVLEIMGAKVAAVQGRFIDHSAWSLVDENPIAAENLGDQLAVLGFQRSGREPLICGMSGEEMEADVFMGISGYQRLRHQVNDKWQSRARTDNFRFRAVSKTGQPVKGRKRHGGVRVGEMERDGLLSHGIAEVVMDRLLHVSDGTKGYICMNCGGLMCIQELHSTHFSSLKQCRYCGAETDNRGGRVSDDTIRTIMIPQVLRLWIAELTGVGVRVTMKVE